MPTLETIRLLRIKAVAEGFDRAARENQNLADSMRDVEEAGEAVARSSDQVVKRQLSVERSLDAVRRKYDHLYRAEQEQARVMAVLDRAYQQNRINLFQRDQILDQATAKIQGYTSAAHRMVAVNENAVRSYSRIGTALSAISPVLDRIGMSGTVGLIGGGTFAAVTAGAAAVTGAGAAIAKAGDVWTTYENRLRTAGEASDTVTQKTRELLDVALRSRSGLGATVDLYANLRTATQDLGRNGAEVQRVVETVNKAFQLNGASAQTASGAILQLGQAFASGTLRGDELNSVLEGAPPLARLIAKEFGVAVGELRQLGEQGALSADRVFSALLKGSASVDEAFNRTTTSLAQASTNAMTAFSQLGAELDRLLGISPKLASAFDAVGTSVRNMAGGVAAFSDEREVQRIQSAMEAIRVYEQQVQDLQGRKDFASQQDLKAALEHLQRYREEFERLTQLRVQSMVPAPEPIILNSEGLLTNERTIRELDKATRDLAAAEKLLATESMTPLAKATQEANEAHQKRLEIYEKLRSGGAEMARINEMIARSEALRVTAIAEAERRADKQTDTERRRAMDAFRRAAPEYARETELRESLGRLQALKPDDMREMGLATEQVATAIQRLQREMANLLSPLDRMAQDAALEVMAIQARTFEEKAAVEAERARIEALRSSRSELEAAAAAEIERSRMVAQAQRQVQDLLQNAQRNADMVGLNPFQRQQRQIEQAYEQQRLQSPVELHGMINAAEALDKWTAAQEAMRGPLEEATQRLNEQIAAARLQADSFGKSAGEIEAAAEAQRLFNEYMRQGVEITPLLAQNIQAYAQRAGQLKEMQEQIQAQQDAYRQINDMGKDALKGFLSDLKEGKSAGEAFLNVLNRILDRLLDMSLDALFDPSKPNPLTTLFGALSGQRGQGAALPSMAANAFPFGTPAAPYSVPMIPAPQPISANIAGSLVPAIRQATAPMIDTIGDTISSGLKNTFTKVTDGLRFQVESLVRHEAFARGLDPDIVARGINQESGFNPYAIGDNGKSFGVMQLYTGGGLGNEALRRGISLDPSNWPEHVRFGVGIMQKQGLSPWHGFRDIGITDPWAAHRAFRGSAGTNALGGTAGFDQLAPAVEQATTSFESLTPSLDQFGSGFQNVTQTITQGVPQLQQNFSQLPSMIGQGGDAVGDALGNTAGVIGQGANGIGGALNSLGQALSGMGGGGGFGGLGGLFGGLFGGGGGFDWSGFNIAPAGGWDAFMGIWHDGGTVGPTSRLRRMTLADQIAFMSAPRLHAGNLRPGERRAILEDGERVLSRQDVKAMNRSKQGSSQAQQGNKPTVIINNYTPAETRVEERPDGSVEVYIEQMEGRLADRAKRGRGQLVKAIGARREGNALIG